MSQEDSPENNHSVENEINSVIRPENNDANKKKVRFPQDSDIVSDYFEAKEYWNENRFCTSEELLNSYKKICEKYMVKSIPIILEQIKGIDMILCRERYEMLNFSNTKLDIKHIECLEEIFKRVQFKTLNFENCNLDDESASSLFEIIEFYESCLKLNISYNTKINYPGFNSCSKMLKKTPCLDTIELKGIMFTDMSIPPLNRALRSGSHLRVLHLEHSNICSKNLLILSSALKLNVFLKELHLASNRLVPSDGIQLGSLLKVNKYLEVLDVRNNSLGDIGLGHICDGLCGQAVSLNNQNNNLSRTESDPNDSYESYINGNGLMCLILWSNSITYSGMYPLAEAIRIHPNIQSLNLGNNPITSEGVHVLRDGLLGNRSLNRLSLPCCRITCEGGVAIAEYIADTRQLMRLDLRENDIKTAGLLAISLSMRVNQSITRIDLDQSPKRDANVKGYAESQMEYLKVILSKVQENKQEAEKQAMNLQSLSMNHDQEQKEEQIIQNDETPNEVPLSHNSSSQIPEYSDEPKDLLQITMENAVQTYSVSNNIKKSVSDNKEPNDDIPEEKASKPTINNLEISLELTDDSLDIKNQTINNKNDNDDDDDDDITDEVNDKDKLEVSTEQSGFIGKLLSPTDIILQNQENDDIDISLVNKTKLNMMDMTNNSNNNNDDDIDDGDDDTNIIINETLNSDS